MHVSAPGSQERQLTVDEFIDHVNAELSGESDTFSGDYQYSVNAEGEVEILFFNGLFICSKDEFDELKQKTPDVNWKEYPNDVAPDEVDEVISYLKTNDIVPKTLDVDELTQELKVLLSADPKEFSMGSDYPEWLSELRAEDIDSLARGVAKVLGHREPNTPEDAVDKMLDD